MSFFVLNTLDLKPDHLNKYYFKRRKKEKFDELSSQEVKDTIKNDLPPLLNSLEKYQNFVINVQIAVPNSKQNINAAKNNIKEIKSFYSITKKVVLKLGDNSEKDIGKILELDSNQYSIISVEEFEELDEILGKIYINYFIEDEIQSDQYRESEKFKEIEKIFGYESNLFKKYCDLCEYVYKEELGGVRLDDA